MRPLAMPSLENGGLSRLRARQLTWVIGGALLTAAAVVGSLAPSPLWYVVSAWLGAVLYAASLVLFALGLQRSGSVTDRRPTGTTALVILGLWSVALPVIQSASIGASLEQSMWVVEVLARFAIALVAVVQVGRAGVVPGRWRWAPAFALAAVAFSWVAGEFAPSALVEGWFFVDALIRLGAGVFLGVVAIVLGVRASVRTVIIAPKQ